MPQFAHLLLGQILVDHHRLPAESVKLALQQQKQKQHEKGESCFIGEILVERRVITREQLAQALTFQQEQFAQSMVGSYRLQSLLGRGGTGMVYRAILLSGKSKPTPVALKLIPQRSPGDVDALAGFQREAQAGTTLDHPHIVRTFDFGTTRDSYWIVCELMSGGSLLELVRTHGLLEESTALRLALAMLQALDHALARGLVHRDIKPANILFDDNGSPHLADLGLAQFTQKDADGPRERSAGTPAFIAPEQAIGQDRYDTRSDLYSLGATLFYALTGSPPFVDPVRLNVINQHLNAAPPEVDVINRSISSHTAAFVRKLLAKRFEDRYATPTEALDDVRRIQAGIRPLALALTPEQAYAPLKVQIQTRGGGKLTDQTPPVSAINAQAMVGTTNALTPRGNREVTGAASTTTPRGNRQVTGAASTTTPRGNRQVTGAASTTTPRGNRQVTGAASTPTPRGNRVQQQRAEPGTQRETAMNASASPAPAARGRNVPQSDDRARQVRKQPLTKKSWSMPMIALISAVVIFAITSAILLVVLFNPPPASPVTVVKNKLTPVPDAVVVDLMPKFDAQILKRGDWVLRDGVLMSPRGSQHLLPIGWVPPTEYDLTCSFKRLYPSGSLSLIFNFSGHQYALKISGDSDTRIGFELIGANLPNDHESLYINPEPLTQDKRIAVTIKVRHNGLSAHIGDKKICSMLNPSSNHKMDDVWKLPQNHVLGIGTRTTQVAVFRLALTELSGSGLAVPATPVAN